MTLREALYVRLGAVLVAAAVPVATIAVVAAERAVETAGRPGSAGRGGREQSSS